MKKLLTYFPACLILFLFGGGVGYGQTFEWELQLRGNDYAAWVNSVATDEIGNIYATGKFDKLVDFDPGPDTFEFSPVGGADIFVLKLNSQGQFLWVKTFGGASQDIGETIKIDKKGYVYVTGSIDDAVNFDPQGTTLPITEGGFFALKLNDDGEFIWVRRLGFYTLSNNLGGLFSYVKTFGMTIDEESNVYTTGAFIGTYDFDPGPGDATLFADHPSVFIQKLDAFGNFLWVRQIGGNGNCWTFDLATDPYGNVYVTGPFKGSIDFDPGINEFERIGSGDDGEHASYILKLDRDGNFQWVRLMGTGSSFWQKLGSFGITCDSDGNVYSTGFFDGGLYVEGATTGLSDGGNRNIFVTKRDSSGLLVWIKQMAGYKEGSIKHKGGGIGWDITVDNFDNVYTVGFFGKTVDFDPGLGITSLYSSYGEGIFMQKMDVDGNFIWAEAVGANNSDERDPKVAIDGIGNIFLRGNYLYKWSQDLDSCSSIKLIVDSVSSVTCNQPGYAVGSAKRGTPPFSYSWDTQPAITDSIASFTEGGFYTLSVTDALGCSRFLEILVDGPTSQNQIDLHTNLITTDFRSGFPATAWIDAFNNGCVPASGQIVFELSPLVSFDSASIPPDLIQGGSLIWNYSDLTYDSDHIKIQIFLTTNLGLTLNDQVCFNLKMSPFNNLPAAKANNVKDYCFPVIGSYDPNDIKVYPVGECEVGYIEPDQPLTYTVRFQNTGNADAINVFILDELDKNLNLKTLKILGQSHEPMIPEILDGGILKFRFDDIHLPDSNTNEPESHGYVIFQASPLPGLRPGTVIENQVGIYFDYNDPILTNTVSNRILDTLNTRVVKVENHLTAVESDATYQWVNCETDMPINGATNRTYSAETNGEYYVILSRYGCSDTSECYSVSSGEFGSNMRFFPIPATETLNIDLGERIPDGTVELFSLTGQVSLRQPIENQRTMELDISHIPGGVFFVKITSQGKLATFKVMKE